MTSPKSTTRYADVLGVSGVELRRLLAQTRDLAPETNMLLDRIGIQRGWRVIDLGCGPLGILDLLSERVGPEGEVFGLDLEPRFVAVARQQADELGLGNVRVVQGDAARTGLPPNSFDLVHERLVLIGPNREQVVTEMVALARPGGVVATQEVDMLGAFCEPTHPAWDILLDAFRKFVESHGADLIGGRRLPAFLRQAGLNDVDAEVSTRVARPGQPRRLQLLGLIESVREPLLRQGAFSAEELTEQVASLRAHLEDPRTLVVGGPIIQAWGRKPIA